MSRLDKLSLSSTDEIVPHYAIVSDGLFDYPEVCRVLRVDGPNQGRQGASS